MKKTRKASLTKAIFNVIRHHKAPVTFGGEGTGFNPMVNPDYRAFSLARQRVALSPWAERILKRIGVL